MKVVCDNCRAVYKVPDSKLVKPVNKATCRQCGHRMLIPKPKPGADPDERTLVTAVPPTPAGVSRREDGDPPTTPIDDEAEATAAPAPGGGDPTLINQTPEDLQVFPGTPLPAGQRAGDTLPSPSSFESSTGQLGMTPPMIIRQEAPPSYDPGSDLAWAFLATVGALAGSTLLPFVHLSSNMLISGTVMALGLAMAFGGGMVTLLILLTGQRGRRQANLFLSVGVGGLLGALFAALVTPSLLVAQAVLTDEINFATPVASVDIATPTEDAAPEDDLSVAADSEDGDGDGDGDGDADEDADAEEAPAEDSDETEDSDVGDDSDEGEEGEDGVADASTDAQASPSPTPSPRPRPSSSQAPAPTAAPAPRPAAPAPAPPSGSTGMKQVPNEVIHALLSNNVTVKKCFVPLYRAGKLPPRVDVQFYLQPTGKASASKIQQSEFSGSELDTCLSAAIQKVTFPPSSGSGQRITYPFVLQ